MRRSLQQRRTGLALLLPLLAGGCYHVGFVPEAGLRELAVPVFRNDTLRRHLEVDLTRHVRREVLETTPLHLAGEDEARAVLRGAVQAVREGVLISGPQEQVVHSSVVVSASFGVYEGPRLLIGEDEDGDGRPDAQVTLTGYAEFDLSRGESRASATDEALRDLAEMIVFRLEGRYDDRFEPNQGPEDAQLLEPGRQVALVQRDADWFRARIPPRHELSLTLFGPDAIVLRLSDAAGEAVPGLLLRDAGRIQHLAAGEEARDVFLQLSGDDGGQDYQLLVQVLPDDHREEDDIPGAAGALEPRATLRLLQRDDDWSRLEQPAGQALRVSIRSEAPAGVLELRATDELGAPLAAARHAADGRSVELPAPGEARTVFLRVSGDGQGWLYELEAGPAR